MAVSKARHVSEQQKIKKKRGRYGYGGSSAGPDSGRWQDNARQGSD